MLKKDKQKVIGEELSDDRLKLLLNQQAESGINRDYCILVRAYRALRSHDFERFLVFFTEQGLDIHSPGPDGKTLRDELRQHQQGAPYMAALEKYL